MYCKGKISTPAISTGDAADGASNMQRIYYGFSALLKNDLLHVHTLYYGYILNHVTGDLAGNVRHSTKLFK